MQINNDNIMKMVDRSCLVLGYLYENSAAVGISKIAADLSLPKANVYRILYTLSVHGLVEQDLDSELYRLGKTMIKYGEKVRDDLDIVLRAKPYMKKIARQIGETINIGIEYEGKVITLHSEEGEKSVLVSKLIPVTELYCSSMGKLLLADMSKDLCEKYFEQKHEKRTVNTLTTYDEFKKEITEIKTSGFAVDREEYEYGLSCYAFAIPSSNKKIYAMLSVSGPTTRLEFKGIDNIKNQIKKLAIQIKEELV